MLVVRTSCRQREFRTSHPRYRSLDRRSWASAGKRDCGLPGELQSSVEPLVDRTIVALSERLTRRSIAREEVIIARADEPLVHMEPISRNNLPCTGEHNCETGGLTRLHGKVTRTHAPPGFVEVTVETTEDGARVKWTKVAGRFDWATLSAGFYLLRTNVRNWSDEEHRKAYIRLTEAKAAFRIHNSDLSLRPIWHQKEDRVLARIAHRFFRQVRRFSSTGSGVAARADVW